MQSRLSEMVPVPGNISYHKAAEGLYFCNIAMNMRLPYLLYAAPVINLDMHNICMGMEEK